MFEEQSFETNSPILTMRIILAVIFIALAVMLGVWVLKIVNTTINDTKTPAIVQKIIPTETNPVDINTPAGRFELPKQAFNVMAYCVLFFFLMIPTSIAVALIKGSVSLLVSDPSRQLHQLAEAIRKSIPPKQ
jgi:hypothetical protein